MQGIQPRMQYVRVFWPTILYLATFAGYVFLVVDFLFVSMRFLELHVPCLITNLFVLPGIAVIQLVYGIYKLLRSKERHYWLHVFSSLAVFGLLIVFFLLVSLGFVATV